MSPVDVHSVHVLSEHLLCGKLTPHGQGKQQLAMQRIRMCCNTANAIMQPRDAATACTSAYIAAGCAVIAMPSTTGIALMSAMSSADTTVPAGSVPSACIHVTTIKRELQQLWEKFLSSGRPRSSCLCMMGMPLYKHLRELKKRVGRAHAEQAAADLATSALCHELTAHRALLHAGAPVKGRN